MSSDTWPPALKDWVAKCLGQMTDANRAEAQAELRQLIQDAFNAQTLWTTDWAGMKLTSLEPKVPSVFNQSSALKRKAEPHVTTTRKKKTPLVEHSVSMEITAKEKRARRFEREHELERRRGMGLDPSPSQTPTPPPNNTLTRKARLQQSTTYGEGDPVDVTPDLSFPDWQQQSIVGRSQELFKDYLRLTDIANPDNVRPLSVLKRTLSALVERWKSDENYNWICSQFKSMRQDMKVQGINTAFTVKVYEIHARMAIQTGDLVEFNQCLSQLKLLYLDNIEGRKNEFTAYRMLFMLHARQRSELNSLIGELTPEEKAEPEIRHALLVSSAISTNNYHSLFQLYSTVPNMGAYIMDFFVPRARALAVIVMCKAYRTLPLSFLAAELGFDHGIDEAHQFLVTLGAAYYANPNSLITERLLDTRIAGPAVMNIYEEKFTKVAIKGSI